MPYTDKGIYYPDNDTVSSVADITFQMAESIGDHLGVLQVVSASTSTVVQNSSYSTYAASGLTATITPSRSSSKVLVLVSEQFDATSANNTGPNAAQAVGATFQLLRGTTEIANNYFSIEGFYAGSSTATIVHSQTASFNFIDSPATTSPVTYSVKGKPRAQVAPSWAVNLKMNSSNGSAAQSNIFLLEIAA